MLIYFDILALDDDQPAMVNHLLATSRGASLELVGTRPFFRDGLLDFVDGELGA
jgi:hypothetical protein